MQELIFSSLKTVQYLKIKQFECLYCKRNNFTINNIQTKIKFFSIVLFSE